MRLFDALTAAVTPHWSRRTVRLYDSCIVHVFNTIMNVSVESIFSVLYGIVFRAVSTL